MAALVRPWVVRYVDAAGKRCKSTDPGAKQVKERAAKWHGQGIPGLPPKKRIPLATSKPVAQRMLEDLVRKAERGQTTLPDLDAGRLELGKLLAEFAELLGRKAEATHVAEVVRDAKRVFSAVDAVTVADLRRPDLAAKAEAAVWGFTEGAASVSAPTAAKIGMHARQFVAWLVRKKKLLDHDPLTACDFPSQKTQNPRRALSPAELAKVLEAAENDPDDFRGLYGPDRAILYLTAVATGYRAGELAVLEHANFDLDGAIPVVRLSKEDAKNDTAAEQPLPPAVAGRLRAYLATRPRQDRSGREHGTRRRRGCSERTWTAPGCRPW